jgi:hypothetical protein
MEGYEMNDFQKTWDLLENLERLADQLERSFVGFRDRNTVEALAMKNTVDSRIIELNSSIGFLFYK